MTCTRARALIDTASFMGSSPAAMDAARRHAQQCETCRGFLTREAEFVADVQALAVAVETPDLTAGVLARIIANTDRSADVNAQADRAVMWWSVPVAGIVAMAVMLGVSGPDVLARLSAVLGPSRSPHGVVQPAFTLASVALYLAVLLMPLLSRREA